jgi:hypothetical protein
MTVNNRQVSTITIGNRIGGCCQINPRLFKENEMGRTKQRASSQRPRFSCSLTVKLKISSWSWLKVLLQHHASRHHYST